VAGGRRSRWCTGEQRRRARQLGHLARGVELVKVRRGIARPRAPEQHRAVGRDRERDGRAEREPLGRLQDRQGALVDRRPRELLVRRRRGAAPGGRPTGPGRLTAAAQARDHEDERAAPEMTAYRKHRRILVTHGAMVKSARADSRK
jgi:hypothetical protein